MWSCGALLSGRGGIGSATVTDSLPAVPGRNTAQGRQQTKGKGTGSLSLQGKEKGEKGAEAVPEAPRPH